MPSTSAAATSLAASQTLGNMTSLTPDGSLPSSSPRHLLSLPFRVLPAGSSVVAFPRRVARLVGFESMASRIMGRASDAGIDGHVAAAQTAGGAAGEGMAEAAGQSSGLRITDIFYALKRFSGFFSYVTSRWSLTCFSVVGTVRLCSGYAADISRPSF